MSILLFLYAIYQKYLKPLSKNHMPSLYLMTIENSQSIHFLLKSKLAKIFFNFLFSTFSPTQSTPIFTPMSLAFCSKEPPKNTPYDKLTIQIINFIKM
jgi:hypothetical protein